MSCRTWVPVGTMLAVAAAYGQNPGQAAIEKSEERVVFFTGSVMLEDGSAPAESVMRGGTSCAVRGTSTTTFHSSRISSLKNASLFKLASSSSM